MWSFSPFPLGLLLTLLPSQRVKAYKIYPVYYDPNAEPNRNPRGDGYVPGKKQVLSVWCISFTSMEKAYPYSLLNFLVNSISYSRSGWLGLSCKCQKNILWMSFNLEARLLIYIIDKRDDNKFSLPDRTTTQNCTTGKLTPTWIMGELIIAQHQLALNIGDQMRWRNKALS